MWDQAAGVELPKPYWPRVYLQALQWLDEEGEPDARAEVERYIRELLAAKSTLQRHAKRCIEQHRARRQADE